MKETKENWTENERTKRKQKNNLGRALKKGIKERQDDKEQVTETHKHLSFLAQYLDPSFCN